MPGKPIDQPKLLLVEGTDAYFFFIWACQAFGVEGVQVVNFGGINDIGVFLKTIKEVPGYDKVSTLVIARMLRQTHVEQFKVSRPLCEKMALRYPTSPSNSRRGRPALPIYGVPGP
jgi:hypothetical protein